jgi:hypothetical protein
MLDSVESAHAASVGDAPLVIGNIADDPLVASIVAEHRVDAVVHFAGYKAAGRIDLSARAVFHEQCRCQRHAVRYAAALRCDTPGVFVLVRGVRHALPRRLLQLGEAVLDLRRAIAGDDVGV